jgi:hypothetical protein
MNRIDLLNDSLPRASRSGRSSPARAVSRLARAASRPAYAASRTAAWLAAFALLMGIASSAGAQPASQYTKDEALNLFNEARALAAAGKYEEACPKFEKAQAIDPGMGTLFNLAGCYAQIGRIASAWAAFRDVASAASAAGQVDREKVARERAAALEPRLSKLRISVPEEAMAPGLEVQRDGVTVASLIWGTDVPVDPGNHLVSASAPGREPWSAVISVAEPGKVVVLRVPPLAPKKPAAPQPPGPTPKKPLTDTDGRSAIPAVLLGTLAAGGIAGGVAMLVVAGKKGDRAGTLRQSIQANGGQDNACLASPRPLECAELDTTTLDQVTFKGVAIGAFVVSGVAAAGFLTYVLWPSPSSREPAPSSAARLSLTVTPTTGGGGLVAAGTF